MQIFVWFDLVCFYIIIFDSPNSPLRLRTANGQTGSASNETDRSCCVAAPNGAPAGEVYGGDARSSPVDGRDSNHPINLSLNTSRERPFISPQFQGPLSRKDYVVAYLLLFFGRYFQFNVYASQCFRPNSGPCAVHLFGLEAGTGVRCSGGL